MSTTITQIPPAVRAFYDRVLLERATPYLAHNLFGQKRPVPQKKGDQPRFRKYSALTTATAPLVEGVTPTAQQLSKTDVDGQLVQYGTYVEITDYVQFTNQDPTLTEAAEVLGENAGETLDIIYRDVLNGGTSVQYAGSVAARGNIVTKIAAADLDIAIRALKAANAKYWMENPIPGNTAVGTTPIAGSYFAITDSYVERDLNAITGYVPVHKYPNPSIALPGEVGSYRNIRFVESSNSKVRADLGGTAVTNILKYTTGTSNCDIHTILIFGKNAYGVTDLQGRGLEIINKPLGSGDDPLNQRSTSGWKACTDCLILNESLMYRIECGVSR